MSSDNASSAVTYTSISSNSNGPSWGILLVNAGELSEIDPYEEVAQQGQAPPLSPAYVPNPMKLDEHVPVYVLEPEHSEYHVPLDDDIQPEDDDEDPEEDPEEDHTDYPVDGEDGDDEPSDDDDDDDDTDDEDEEPTEDEDEEEHLAPVDPSAVPVVDHVPSARDTEAFKTDESAPTPRSPQTRVPFSQTRLRKAQKTIRLEPPMSASMEACIAEHAAAHIPPTNTACDQALLGHRVAMICMRDDIPEEDMPPRRRFILTASPPGCDVAESSAAAAARPPRGLLSHDLRKLKEGGKVKEFQRSFRHSDTAHLSGSDKVLKLRNFKKDVTLKLSKSSNQERYEHVGPEVTSPQDCKVTRWQRDCAWLMISRCSRSRCQIQVQGTSSIQKSMITTTYSQEKVKRSS
ncbi:hypothetical protein Tco_1261525 [Tanacetum coccineum]